MNFFRKHQKLITIMLSILILILIVVKFLYDPALIHKIRHTLSILAETDIIILILIVLMSPLNWLTEAGKWRYLLLRIQPLSVSRALGSVMSGMSFAMVSPGKVGDFAGRLLYLEPGIRWRAFFMSIIGSFSHFVVTTCMGAIGLIFLTIKYPSTLFVTLLCIAVLGGGLGVFLFLRINVLTFTKKTKRIKNKWLRKLYVSLRVVNRYRREDLLRVLMISLFKFLI